MKLNIKDKLKYNVNLDNFTKLIIINELIFAIFSNIKRYY